jgi:hypothetical protein
MTIGAIGVSRPAAPPVSLKWFHRNGCAIIAVLKYSLLMAAAFILYRFNEWKAERGFSFHLVFGSCLVASLLVSSCATPYQPLDHRYGYSEQQVGKDVYEVSFLGNGNSSYERVSDYAMLRTAEIALSRQAKSFTLLDVVNLSSVRRYQTPSRLYWTVSPYPSDAGQTILPAAGPAGWTEWRYLAMEPAEERIYYRPGVKLKVQLLPDPPGSYYPYDPVKASERLKRKYRIKPGKR